MHSAALRLDPHLLVIQSLAVRRIIMSPIGAKRKQADDSEGSRRSSRPRKHVTYTDVPLEQLIAAQHQPEQPVSTSAPQPHTCCHHHSTG